MMMSRGARAWLALALLVLCLGWAGAGTGQGLPPARGEIAGTGPVRVALIVPLSGGAGLAGPARAIRNGAVLALEAAGAGAQIHLVIKDSGADPQRAGTLAREAVGEGARLILGPIRAEAVEAAAGAVDGSGVPIIGFSSTGAVAGPGVFLLSVLPEVAAMRGLGHARDRGARAGAAIVPDNRTGAAHEAAFRAAASAQAMTAVAVERFADEAGARAAVEALGPLLRSGRIDTLYLPDPLTAPSLASLLEAVQYPKSRVLIVGSAQWAEREAIAAHPFLSGAVYPAPDAGAAAGLAAAYRARFSAEPDSFAMMGFAAASLADTPGLVMAGYLPAMIARAGGFMGPEGPFRFHLDGRGEYGLGIFEVRAEGAALIEAGRMGGIPLDTSGRGSSDDGIIPPVGESLLRE
ncbi:penicillin-binding protein activator [Pelagibacterium montanilacus]|uniref:penicillin-binding protein activator n=1 Tax=Pelagibacterium montanilacus TaxID=2185280 RepID=UPI0013E01693|nr:penicillin-binding protein activator [Pelagibacterium montanilacus]